MSFLRRGSSMTGIGNVRKRLPAPGEVFREGYIYRKCPKMFAMVQTWTRNFCILQYGELSFQPNWQSFKDDTSPLVSHKISSSTTITPVPKKAFALQIDTPGEPQLQISFDSEYDFSAWKYVIELEIQKQNGAEVNPPSVRSRFIEGILFKTPPVPDRWEERWFELSGDGELSYWLSSGNNKRGVIDLETCKVLPNRTDAKGICTPFFFQIHTFVQKPASKEFLRRIYNLSAPTQVEYLNWLKALKVWIGVKRPPPLGISTLPQPIVISSPIDAFQEEYAQLEEQDIPI